MCPAKQTYRLNIGRPGPQVPQALVWPTFFVLDRETMADDRKQNLDNLITEIQGEAQFDNETLAAYWEEARRYLDAGRYEDLRRLVEDVFLSVSEERRNLERTGEALRFYTHALDELTTDGERDVLPGFETRQILDKISHEPDKALCESLGVPSGVYSFDVHPGESVGVALDYIRTELTFATKDLKVTQGRVLLGSHRHDVLERALDEYRITGTLGTVSLEILRAVVASNDDLQAEVRGLNNLLASAHESIKRLRGRIKALELTDKDDWTADDLRRLIDQVRNKKGDAVYSRLAEQMGLSDKTAKAKVEAAGLANYARPSRL